MSALLELKCQDCGNEFSIQKQCIEKRRERAGQPICVKCYREYSKGGRYEKNHYPDVLQDRLDDEYWDYEMVKPYLSTLRTKKKVKFKCQECLENCTMPINTMKRRKICGTKPICTNCSLKFATNSEEWRDANSKAQYIAQNRPEVLEKQRQSQRRLMAKDPMYAEKRCSKSFISGTIRNIRFDSSWELYFIGYCWDSSDIENIDRYRGSIDYKDKNGKKRKYYPDFIVTYKNGKKRIVEIKGSKEYNSFHEKFKSAKKEFGIRYVVYGFQDLFDMGIFVKRETYLKPFFKRYYSEIKFYNNKKTDAIKKRIELWLK